MMVVIADRDAEGLLGFVLLNDETIQMALDIARSKLELKDRMRLRLGGRFFSALRWICLRRRGKAGAEELLETLLQLLGRRQVWLAHYVALSVMCERLARGSMRRADHIPREWHLWRSNPLRWTSNVPPAPRRA